MFPRGVMHPRDALRAEYDVLVVRFRDRFGEPPPPFPTDGDLNKMANLNRWLIGELLGKPQLQVTVKQTPVLFPLKEPRGGGQA